MLAYCNDALQSRYKITKKLIDQLDVGVRTGNLRAAFDALAKLRDDLGTLQVEVAAYNNAALESLQMEVQKNAEAQYQQAAEALDSAQRTLNRFVNY